MLSTVPEKTVAGPGHHINVRSHSLLDALEFAFSKIRDCPPPARINQNEHLLADVGVSAFGNYEVGHARFEGRINLAVLEVIPRALDCGFFCAALINQRFQGRDRIDGLFMLSLG